MLIFCKILKTLSSECTNMKNSKWSSKIKLKLKVPRKSVEPRRKLFSAKVMDSRKKVRGKRTRRVLRTIREESRKRFTRFAASAERNLISRCWKWWFPEVFGRFARFSYFLIFGWFWWWISIPWHVFLTRDGPILLLDRFKVKNQKFQISPPGVVHEE